VCGVSGVQTRVGQILHRVANGSPNERFGVEQNSFKKTNFADKKREQIWF